MKDSLDERIALGPASRVVEYGALPGSNSLKVTWQDGFRHSRSAGSGTEDETWDLSTASPGYAGFRFGEG